tara:strand:+ start:251 stop:535 length:285 start_codon:yes stop_codon:yes gene_type:complete
MKNPFLDRQLWANHAKYYKKQLALCGIDADIDYNLKKMGKDNLIIMSKMGKDLKKLEQDIQTLNNNAKKMGGWDVIDKAADAMQAVGLVNLNLY